MCFYWIFVYIHLLENVYPRREGTINCHVIDFDFLLDNIIFLKMSQKWKSLLVPCSDTLGLKVFQ